MGKRVSAENQNEAAMQLVNSLIAIEGVTGEVLSRASGTQTRNIAHLQCEPSSWRKVAETMKYDHEVDHCSMITGIHWPDSSDKNWEVIYHFLRTGVKDPAITEDGSSIIPNITDNFNLVFIDANKADYRKYFEIVIDKIPIGGFIIADNVLWSGKVIEEVNDKDQETKAIKEFNKLIQNSERVENILLPIRDGLMICQKIK